MLKVEHTTRPTENIFTDILKRRLEKMQANAQANATNKSEHLTKVVDFAKLLFTEIISKLSEKPQILATQEARLANQYASQRWLSLECFAKAYTYFELKAAKNARSDYLCFAIDLGDQFTENELFYDAVEFLENEGLITVTPYFDFYAPMYKTGRSSRSDIKEDSIVQLTEKGKQYLKPL